MFLRQVNKVIRGLRFRVAAIYFILVLVSSIVMFGTLYFLLVETLKEKDRRLILSDFKKFALMAESKEPDEILKWFSRKQSASEIKDVYVRLISNCGKVIFLHEPSVVSEIGHDIFNQAVQAAPDEVFSRIESRSDSEDAVEFYSDQLKNGMRLQAGKDAEDRELLLDRFRDAFFVTIAVTLVLAFATAFLFSSKLLRPIQNLIQTVERVRRGDLAARADVKESGDEINELANFLNGMLTQNSKLITALTESLDAVAHDLRTPLTRLRVYAEHAIQRGTSDPETLGAIMDNADQVIELLNAIFDVSEAEAGTLKMRWQTLNIQQTLTNVIDVYSVIAEEKNIDLRVGESVDLEITADIRIKQVVANLVDNAIKFSPNGTIVTVSARLEGSNLVISVADQGPGISVFDEPKIWDRLYRGDASRSTRGMGLGLSLVRSIVHAHGGTVSVHSAKSESSEAGSVFEISLPLTLRVLGSNV